MKKIAKRKPLDFTGQGLQPENKIFFNTTENNDIRQCYQSQVSGYQQLINFVISGDITSAREFIEKAGYSGVLADFLLGNAELDAKLETLAAVMPCGVADE